MVANKEYLDVTTVEWYTPSDILDAARSVLTNGIEFDPASSVVANERVQALSFLTEKEDALREDIQWGTKENPVSVWLNPPSIALKRNHPVWKTRSLAKAFWLKLIQEYKAGRVLDAIYLVVSSNHLHTLPTLLERPICITTSEADSDSVNNMGRIKFIDAQGVMQSAPKQANGFVLFPAVLTAGEVCSFRKHFSKFGKVGSLKY